MCTNDYSIMLNTVVNKILSKELIHKNILITGDNSSGKSELLKIFIKKSSGSSYFIDAVNRTFNEEQISYIKQEFPDKSYINVTNRRIQEDIFNLKDSFDIFKDGSEKIEAIFYIYEEKLKLLMEEFLNINMEIREKNEIFKKNYKIYINGNCEKISSGYQAIMRIFAEIIYYTEYVDSKNTTIVIDEINEFLSAKNEAKIVPFLIDKFPGVNFIITTHSADVISSAENFTILLLKNNNYECLDSNDFNTITDVREIFESLYNPNTNEDIDDVDITLRRLLSIKISDTWTENEQIELDNLEFKTKLSNSQKLILKQIQSW